jgi:hypothetical protein
MTVRTENDWIGEAKPKHDSSSGNFLTRALWAITFGQVESALLFEFGHAGFFVSVAFSPLVLHSIRV